MLIMMPDTQPLLLASTAEHAVPDAASGKQTGGDCVASQYARASQNVATALPEPTPHGEPIAGSASHRPLTAQNESSSPCPS
jgi:hypothetical protein